MNLSEIKGIVSKFAETISKILDIDVMIIDDKYNRIADTFRYVDQSVPITRYSVLGEVIDSGKVVAVKDKGLYKHCINCKDSTKCWISGLIGVPIFFDNKVIGAISLLVPVNKTSPVFENLQNSIDFLERMSDLLSSKLKNIEDYDKLNIIKKEREIIIDTIEDGIVFVNSYGEIMHFNRKFETLFETDKKIIGEKITNLIEHPLINETMKFRDNFSYKLFYYEYKNHSFYGFLSCRNMIINGKDYGALLTFKTLGKVYSVLNEIMDNKANISFADVLGSAPELNIQINRAKQLAVTDENILISGEAGLGKTLLARAIHNFSDRANQYFVFVDCDNTPYELLEDDIFGKENNDGSKPIIGKLRLAHKGTIFFKNISQMPLYLQKRLVEVIKSKKLKQGLYYGFNINVRMVFDTNEDLSILVKQNRFDEELYYRISKNTIAIPPLYKRKGDVKIIVDTTIEKLKQKYLKPNLAFEQDVLDLMYKYSWPNNVREIEKVLELIICNTNESVVKLNDVCCFSFANQGDDKVKTVNQVEKDLIEKMLSEYKSKVQIAKTLGIGRATLYRKMKKYGID